MHVTFEIKQTFQHRMNGNWFCTQISYANEKNILLSGIHCTKTKTFLNLVLINENCLPFHSFNFLVNICF